MCSTALAYFPSVCRAACIIYNSIEKEKELRPAFSVLLIALQFGIIARARTNVTQDFHSEYFFSSILHNFSSHTPRPMRMDELHWARHAVHSSSEIFPLDCLIMLLRLLPERFFFTSSSSFSSNYRRIMRPEASFLFIVCILLLRTADDQLVAGQSDDDGYGGGEFTPLGCEARKLCCTGRDSSCVVSEFHPNR